MALAHVHCHVDKWNKIEEPNMRMCNSNHPIFYEDTQLKECPPRCLDVHIEKNEIIPVFNFT